MFQLTTDEFDVLRSQFVTSSDDSRWGGRRYLPNVFTEHGAIMAASVLNTPRAIDISVYVVRAFIKLRQMLSANKEMAQKLLELEGRVDSHDKSIRSLIVAIRQLMEPAKDETKKAIGFKTRSKKKRMKDEG